MSRNTGNDLMFGQQGSIFTNTTTQVVAPTGMVITMLQFIGDTTFDEITPEIPKKKREVNQLGICVGDSTGQTGRGDAAAGSETETAGSGGQILNVGSSSTLTKFPRGMIIYGRWNSFTIDADPLGGVIAYLDY